MTQENESEISAPEPTVMPDASPGFCLAERVCYHVLELKGDDFVTYVYLGRLAYSRGDYVGWRGR